MTTFYIVFLVPLILYVCAFLYETWLSFARLRSGNKGRGSYVAATWEITHTLLVFVVVTLMMTFTRDIVDLGNAIFWPTFIAAIALGLRAIAYLYIFYIRPTGKGTGWTDWGFALSHLVAAVFLVIAMAKALWFIWQNNPTPNTEFYPVFIPGLILVVAICALPMIVLYRSK